MALDAALLEILACPEDKGPLYYVEDEDLLYNPRLQRVYEIRDGIPVMLVDEARQVDDAEHARLQARIDAESIPPTFQPSDVTSICPSIRPDRAEFEGQKRGRPFGSIAGRDGLTRSVPAGPGPPPAPTVEENPHDHNRSLRRGAARLPRRRPVAGPVRPQGDPPGRARDARPAGPARRVRRLQAARRRPHLRLAAHDDPDGRAHRDAGRARRRGALGELQHLLHPGPRRGGGRRRAPRHAGRPPGRAGLRLEGRDAGGVLVVHRADDDVAGRRRGEHDPRRRRRRHAAAAQGRRVREGRRGARPDERVEPRAGDRPRPAAALAEGRPDEVDAHGGVDQGRHRGDHHRRQAAVQDARRRRAAVPGDQRQRLGDQVEVRQPLRLPPLAGRRAVPGDRRDARRQGRRRRRLRRRRQGLRPEPARPGLPGHRHRDRPDQRPAGGDGGLPGDDARRRRRHRRRVRVGAPATPTSSRPSTWRR